MNSKTQDLLDAVGEKLIKLIEGGEAGKWSKPWQTILSNQSLPTNAQTGKAYQGFNSLYFWIVQADNDYATNLWATYKQWEKLGGQVRKGEKGTQGVKWGVSYYCQTEGAKKGSPKPCTKPGHDSKKAVWASSFTVFNADQQDGYELPEVEDLGTGPERIAKVEAFIAATGANIMHKAQDRAYFKPGTNDIVLPLVEQFETQAGYYGTALHELTHWSGSDGRLERSQRNVFGSSAYAAEELVAEFGSAMLAAHFGIEVEGHKDAASYLAGWVSVIRSDTMALYRAAKQAQEAVDYLLGIGVQGSDPEAVEDDSDALVAV